MRILLVAETLCGNSGWGRYSQDLARELIDNGHHVEALVHGKTDEITIMQHALLPPSLSCLGNLLRPLQIALSLWRISAKMQPDIIHIAVEPYATGLFFWKTSLPTIITMHGTYAVLPLKLNRIARWTAQSYLRRATRLVCVSKYTADLLLDTVHSALREQIEPKIIVIHNGVRLPTLPPPEEAGQPPYNILFVTAIIKKRKGLLEAIRACGEFKRRYSEDFIFHVIGSGAGEDPYITSLHAAILHEGLQQQVILHGRVSEEALHHAYIEADLFIMPSIQQHMYVEGFGLVFLEANARGIPVIGPTTGGCPEAIKEGYSGYVCPPYDASYIADRMADILMQHSISRSQCLHWAEEHDIRRTVKKLEDVYESTFH